MTIAMSWEEWASHDAVALAERVRRGEVTAAELAAQAAAGIAKTNPALSAVVEVFEDVVADPLKDGLDPSGPLAGVPFLMKDLGPTLKGRLQEQGSLFMRGNRPATDAFLTGQMRKAGLNLMGRTTTPEFGVCSSAENPALYVTRNADVACQRRRRLDPHPGGVQRQCRAEALARRLFDRARPLGHHRLCLGAGLPQPQRARHRRLRGCLPRRRAGRVHALLDGPGALYRADPARPRSVAHRALA